MEKRSGQQAVEQLVVTTVNGPITPEAVEAWFNRRGDAPPRDPGVSAAETLAEVRAAGESV